MSPFGQVVSRQAVQFFGIFAALCFAACGGGSAQGDASGPNKTETNAEASGKYEWVCVSTSGSSYSMRAGERLANCKGSHLQKYINGRFIKAYSLIERDAIGGKPPPNAECTIAVTETAIGILTAEDGVSWLLVLAGLNDLRDCVA